MTEYATPEGFSVRELPDRRVHVSHGPIDLLIDIDAPEKRRTKAISDIGATCAGLLERLMADIDALRSEDFVDLVVTDETSARMIAAATLVGRSSFLTPMAAVAGGVADTVCAAIGADGIDRLIVNNGGDIALHLSEGAYVEVGLADGATGELAGKIRIGHSDPVRGVATSGRGGRSLTMGIADSVTVLAECAATADAAATVIAGEVDLPGSAKVGRMAAFELDAASDLGHRPVVTEVAPLTAVEQAAALDRGAVLANELRDRSVIVAAALKLGSSVIMVERLEKPLRLGQAG